MQTKQEVYILKNASFVLSAQNIYQAPPPMYAEVAFLGRSNVGKSSFINFLCKQKNLAKSSATPGKTQLINFFLTKWEFENNDFCLYFIDLPGFGYAKVSKTLQEKWQKNLSVFLQKRDSITLFVHLIDARHGYLANDIALKNFLESFLRPNQRILEVFTKCDKIKRNDFLKLKQQHKQNTQIAFSSILQTEKQQELCNLIAHLALRG